MEIDGRHPAGVAIDIPHKLGNRSNHVPVGLSSLISFTYGRSEGVTVLSTIDSQED
jgi:hypothetical protein